MVFFLGATLTCVGSMYYHWQPDNPRLVWDRLPMTLAFAGLIAAVLGERIGPVWGRRSLWPLLLLVLFPARQYSHSNALFWPIFWYGMAKVAETFDLAICRATATAVSGHTVKHVLAAMAVWALLRMLTAWSP